MSRCVSVICLALASCASQVGARESHVSVRSAAHELMRLGEAATAESVLRASVEATEAELAELYRSLGDAAEAQGHKSQADEWYSKSVALKKFRKSGNKAPVLPMPVDLPSQKLP